METQPAAWSIQLLSIPLWIYTKCGRSCPCFQRPFQDHHCGFYKCFSLFLFLKQLLHFSTWFPLKATFSLITSVARTRRNFVSKCGVGRRMLSCVPSSIPVAPAAPSALFGPLIFFVVRGWNVFIVIWRNCCLCGVFWFPPLEPCLLVTTFCYN